jgi:DNA processing protein
MQNNCTIQTLLNLPRIGRNLASKIISIIPDQINSPLELFELIKQIRGNNKRMPEFTLHQVKEAYSKSLMLFESCSKQDILAISEYDSNYPRRYLLMPDKPLIIFAKGNIDALNSESSVAVIGTRDPTDFGIVACRKLTEYFIDENITIVSGLAQGCDAVAHRTAVDSNGITIAVMPCGLDTVYPKSNAKLYKDILDNNGAVISEYPLQTSMQRRSFVERDRLQSGISDAICIIEAGVKSGTMHTYDYAIKQKRLVGALKHPNDRLSDKSEGNVRVLDDKTAFPLGSPDDISKFIDLIKGRGTI